MGSEVEESKRGRVRRLLIEPLEALGFRRNAKVPADVFKTKMASMIDSLIYMSDQNLAVMFDMLKSKGEGRNRDVWPSAATICGLAELVQPRPVQELPNLLSWFQSVEGPKCLAAGTLVETWAYFQQNKRPPFNAGRHIAEEATRNQSLAQRIRERAAKSRASDDDVSWLGRYEKRLAYCEAIVRGGDEKRAI
ncbi:hypothetical protein JI58_08300 [Marinosulfonomonas sp. PRT-SC04]|nr:hypothetical protein JI58_08300 [Marinosulfonomonas sp. PRT-SC04]